MQLGVHKPYLHVQTFASLFNYWVDGIVIVHNQFWAAFLFFAVTISDRTIVKLQRFHSLLWSYVFIILAEH